MSRLIVDCHNDLVQILAKQGMLGERASLKHRFLPELRAGGVSVQVVPVSAESSNPESTLRESLQQIAELYRQLDEVRDDIQLCLEGAEVREAVTSGRIAFILALEGASMLGNEPSLVTVFHRLGVRMISFTHFGRSWLGDGSGEDGTGGRLTRAGVQVLAEMERLGILMDVTHLGIASTEHVLELARRPVVASHSSARALHDHHRNLSDELIAGIARTGGIVCVNAVPGFIDPATPTIDRMLDHVEHVVGIAGDDHAGIGTDFCVEFFEDLYPDHVSIEVEGIDGRARLEEFWALRQYPALVEAMERRGWETALIEKVLGGNLLNLFDAYLGRGLEGAEAPAPAFRIS